LGENGGVDTARTENFVEPENQELRGSARTGNGLGKGYAQGKVGKPCGRREKTSGQRQVVTKKTLTTRGKKMARGAGIVEHKKKRKAKEKRRCQAHSFAKNGRLPFKTGRAVMMGQSEKKGCTPLVRKLNQTKTIKGRRASGLPHEGRQERPPTETQKEPCLLRKRRKLLRGEELGGAVGGGGNGREKVCFC